MNFKSIFTISLISSLCLVLGSCNSSNLHSEHEAHNHEIEEGHDHENEGHDHYHGSEANEEHGDDILFPVEKAKAAGVKTTKVAAGSFSEIIPTSGQILPSTAEISNVVATRTGIVKLLRPWSIGMNVGAGVSLLSISTSKLPDADPDAKARIDYNKAKSSFERAEKLYNEKLISASEYQQAKNEFENSAALIKNNSRESSSGVVVTSPINGYISDCFVQNGEYVEVGTPLMTISNNRKLRLQADLPQRYYHKIGSIRSANFKLPQTETPISIKDLNGKLISYGKSTDNSGGFIPIVFEFDNSSGIPSGIFTEVYLLGSPVEGVISVPKAALIEEQGVYSVFVQEDENCYNKRNVKIGKSDGLNVEIVDGLKVGETIVTQGAMHIKLASAKNVIPGHTHNH